MGNPSIAELCHRDRENDKDGDDQFHNWGAVRNTNS